MPFASCSYVAGQISTALADVQPKIKDCSGADLPLGAQVPTCAQMNTAISAGVAAALANPTPVQALAMATAIAANPAALNVLVGALGTFFD